MDNWWFDSNMRILPFGPSVLHCFLQSFPMPLPSEKLRSPIPVQPTKMQVLLLGNSILIVSLWYSASLNFLQVTNNLKSMLLVKKKKKNRNLLHFSPAFTKVKYPQQYTLSLAVQYKIKSIQRFIPWGIEASLLAFYVFISTFEML